MHFHFALGNSLHLKKYVQEDVCSPIKTPSPFTSRLKQQKKQKVIKKTEKEIEIDDNKESPKTTDNGICVSLPAPTCMVVYGFTDKNTTIDNVVQLPPSMSDRLVTESNALGLPSTSFCLILGLLTNHGPMPITKYSLLNKNKPKKNTSASSTPTCDSKNKTETNVKEANGMYVQYIHTYIYMYVLIMYKHIASPSASLFTTDATDTTTHMPNTHAFAQNIQNIIMPSLNASDLNTVASLLSPPNTQFAVITTPKLLSPNTHYYQPQQQQQQSMPSLTNTNTSRIAGLTPINITKPSASSSYCNTLQINTNLLHTQQQLHQMMMSPNGMNTPLVTTPFFTGSVDNTPVNTLSFPQTTNWWQNTQQYPNILPTPPHPNINDNQKFFYTHTLLSQNNPPPHPSTLGVQLPTDTSTAATAAAVNTQFYQQSNTLPTPSSTKSSIKRTTTSMPPMSVNNSVAAAAVQAVLQSGDQSRDGRNEYYKIPNGMPDNEYRHNNRRMIDNMLNINTNINMSPERDRGFSGLTVSHSTPVVMITNLNEGMHVLVCICMYLCVVYVCVLLCV